MTDKLLGRVGVLVTLMRSKNSGLGKGGTWENDVKAKVMVGDQAFELVPLTHPLPPFLHSFLRSFLLTEKLSGRGSIVLQSDWKGSMKWDLSWPWKDLWGSPDKSVGQESACKAGDPGSISGLERSPGEETGYPLQYSGLENSLDCMYSPWGCKELDMTERLSLSLSGKTCMSKEAASYVEL